MDGNRAPYASRRHPRPGRGLVQPLPTGTATLTIGLVGREPEDASCVAFRFWSDITPCVRGCDGYLDQLAISESQLLHVAICEGDSKPDGRLRKPRR